MSAYQIQGPTRRCATTDRELVPGDKIVSVLLDEGGQLLRKDYAFEIWQTPPPGAIAYWVSKIPKDDTKKKPIFNDEFLLDCFTHLESAQEPNKLHFRYIVGLLLMRRKRFRFEDVQKRGEQEIMMLRDVKSKQLHEVLDPHLTEEQLEAVHQEVSQVFGWN